MTRWEYCVIVGSSESVTNFLGQRKSIVETNVKVMGKEGNIRFQYLDEAYYQLGQNGWELVTITQGKSGTTIWECHYFKRPLTEE